LPESWIRFCSLIRALPKEPLPKNELLDIFYNGLTDESKSYLDSCAGCIFRERTLADAEKLMAKISRNHDDWTLVEPTPAPTPVILQVNVEDQRSLCVVNDQPVGNPKRKV
jgi:hypothetical protein